MSWFVNFFKKILNNEGIRQEPDWSKIRQEPVDLTKKTKKQLEEYGRTLGVELDRRYSKDKLIAQLEALDK